MKKSFGNSGTCGKKSVLLNAVVPYVENRWQPLCALWNKHALNAFQALPGIVSNIFLSEGNLNDDRVEEENLTLLGSEALCLKKL